jgi:Icc protein
MKRREFIRQLGLGLAAGWALRPWSWPLEALAGGPELRIALLADAHLKDGDPARASARLLARAVSEIRALKPAPDLVLFAGDLAHRGRPHALDLGKEILSDLPAPLLAVMGEGDTPDGTSAPWARRFGDGRFSFSYKGVHLLGLPMMLYRRRSLGLAFEVGEEPRRWLARELGRLNPATPLIILSHAPLARLYLPWQQWTVDAPEIAALLAPFQTVLCLHGHVHQAGARDQGSGVNGTVASGDWSVVSKVNDFGRLSLTENRKQKTENRLSIPATAWPYPQALQGTPAQSQPHRPGQGPRGCGFSLLTLRGRAYDYQPHIWLA